MTKKRRRLLQWSAFALAVLGAGTWAGLRLLRPAPAGPADGLTAGVVDEAEEPVPASAPTPRFERLPVGFRHFAPAGRPGVRTHRLPEDMGSGIAVADLDGDGLEDLFFVQSGPLGTTPPPCELWRGRPGPRFERVDTPLPALHGLGVAVADAEGDGDLDLYVTGFGGNVLLRNDGGLRFTDVTGAAGVAGGGFSAGACWGDLDGDGDLDLYVARYVVDDPTVSREPVRRGSLALPASLSPSAFRPATNLLFLQEAPLRFREAAHERGVDNPTGRSLGAVIADLDGDGLQDVYVANDVSDNAYFRGRSGGTFEDATHASLTADPEGAMGLALGDWDRDGDLDLFITHWLTEGNLLLERTAHGLAFADVSLPTYLGPPGRGRVGWGCDFADLDDDGRPDLFVVNGSTFEVPTDRARLIPQRPQLFWNGGERFFDLVERAGPEVAAEAVARASVAADLDRDGRVDWVMGVHGGEPRVWRNVTEGVGRFLVVEPRGAGANPAALGAFVTVEAGGTRQAQQVGTRVSYLSSGPAALHFGLGTAERADRVRVRYPSGRVVERRDVPAGTRLVVPEADARALGSALDAVGDALHAGRLDEARAGLRAVLAEDPRHPGALYRLATLAEPAEALALLDRLAPVEPTSARGPLLRAKLLSDPRHPAVFDLAAASRALSRARAINPNETGVGLGEGRVLLLQGRREEAARVFESGTGNPRSIALAALCRLKLGDTAAATRLLGRPPGQGPPHAEEGDTALKKLGERDPIARLLDLGPDPAWRIVLLPLTGGAGERCDLTDVDADGHLDARVGGRAVLLEGLVNTGVRDVPAGPARAPGPPAPPYDLEAAARFALDPPALITSDPPGTTAAAEADADGDGDLDRFVVCGGDDPGAPLPWWLLLRVDGGWRPVRGALPVPGARAAALAAADLDGDGRAEVLLSGGGAAAGDTGPVWIAVWTGAP